MVTYLSFELLGYLIEFQRELALKKGLTLETSTLLTVFLEVRKDLHNNSRFMGVNSCDNNKVLLTFNFKNVSTWLINFFDKVFHDPRTKKLTSSKSCWSGKKYVVFLFLPSKF